MAQPGDNANYSPGTKPSDSDSASADLTIAVIDYQTPLLLEECLLRLRRAAPKARLLVVDTGDSLPLPSDWPSEHPDVELLREPNHSYASAVNAALKRCLTGRFAQMNSDVLVEPDTFERLEQAMVESGAAMVAPLMRDREGRRQRQGVPYRWFQWRAGRTGRSTAPWLSGSLQYLDMSAVERVGGMDGSLRFYNEDVEWCLRLRASGQRCVLVGCEVTHLGGSSTPSSSAFLVEGLRGSLLVTLRYHGALAGNIHRFVALAIVAPSALLSRDEERRSGYRQATIMFWRGDFAESPFGSSLSNRNPEFLGSRAVA